MKIYMWFSQTDLNKKLLIIGVGNGYCPIEIILQTVDLNLERAIWKP